MMSLDIIITKQCGIAAIAFISTVPVYFRVYTFTMVTNGVYHITPIHLNGTYNNYSKSVPMKKEEGIICSSRSI